MHPFSIAHSRKATRSDGDFGQDRLITEIQRVQLRIQAKENAFFMIILQNKIPKDRERGNDSDAGKDKITIFHPCHIKDHHKSSAIDQCRTEVPLEKDGNKVSKKMKAKRQQGFGAVQNIIVPRHMSGKGENKGGFRKFGGLYIGKPDIQPARIAVHRFSEKGSKEQKPRHKPR